MTHISAIDIGFLYTKAIIDGKQVKFKSVVGNGREQNFQNLDFGMNNNEDNITVKTGLDVNFVSDLAINQSDVVLHSLEADRFSNEVTKQLVLTAFGLGFGSDHVETKIVSGLPVSHYSKYQEEIKKLFVGDGSYKIHNFDVTSKGYQIKGSAKVVEAEFIPQPFGALLDRILDKDGDIADKELAKQTVAVIDPGFGTTDVYVSRSLSPIERLTFSTPTAMNFAYDLIANKIEEQTGISLAHYKLEKAVSNKYYRVEGKQYDLTAIIQWAFRSASTQLVTEVLNRWKANSKEIDKVLIAGGTGAAWSKWLKEKFPTAEILEDTQWAVANGYYKWGVRKFG
ncbi:hypothetical protein [Bacillus phage SPO1L5]|nr:putative actin-like protein [Bacillus phage vB_BsuM-Goe10]WIT26661.1 hypothetical protein [Bacillus phage SPO1L5]